MSTKSIASCAALAAVVGATALSAQAGREHGAYRPCLGDSGATIANGVIRYCGPATVRLSVFRGVTFANGTCLYYGENDAPTIRVDLGSRSFDRKANNGLRYVFLSVSTRPGLNESGIEAYSKGRRWQGRIVTRYDGRSTAGRLVARGKLGSRGRATGSFRCVAFKR